MATTKNITMKQFNGTDYDTLYPKTKVEQVENLTPSSIGAVANTGGIMTGQLSVPAFALTNYNAALEIGKNIDFHVAGSTNDYDARLAYDSGALLFRMHGGDYKTMLHTGNLSALGVAKIVTGSYVGTGGYKESNPTTLSFDFVPKVVIFYQKDSGGVAASSKSRGGALLVNGVTKYYVSDYIGDSSNTEYITITWNGNSVSWYGDDAEAQMNKSGIEYVYAAFG